MKRRLRPLSYIVLVLALGGAFFWLSTSARAAAPPAQNPQSGSTGIQGTIPAAPPKSGATITTPTNGQVFTKTPITVAGLCPSGLLVKIFVNNVFLGSGQCTNGSYSIQVDLFGGKNDIVARVFDALDQPGPDSNTVSVTFNDAQFASIGGQELILSSNYAERGANPGEILTWPIIITGGNGPYAISVNWGDNKPTDLVSQQFPGTFNVSHIYDSAGVYTVIVKATDKDGRTAFLQLVGVANGAVTSSSPNGTGTTTNPAQKPKILWQPAVAMLPLLLLAFWLGRRYELSVLRRHLESRD